MRFFILKFEKIYQPDFSLPAQIAEDYEILSYLKYSQERQVYLLEHKNKKTKVILKCGTGIQKRLLEKEYGMLEELEGKPFPLPVLFIRDETWVYSLRQYIEGRTLRELCEGKTMTEAEASETIQKICEILGKLHARRPPLIYRDLKPENIVVAEDGSFYLIDLDTARQYKEDGKKDNGFFLEQRKLPLRSSMDSGRRMSVRIFTGLECCCYILPPEVMEKIQRNLPD